MCGIFGSFNFKSFAELYDINKERGVFAKGLYFLKNGEGLFAKGEGGDPIDNLADSAAYFDQFLGHTQAPTSSQREYDVNTTHPFHYNDWIIAHNGILDNFEDLKEKYCPGLDNPVDSSIIPIIINKLHKEHDEVEAIAKTCDELEGTFALWIVHTLTRNVYALRSGSTLFGNFKDGTFSSIASENHATIPFEEGKIYHVSCDGITPVGCFICNSPFLDIDFT